MSYKNPGPRKPHEPAPKPPRVPVNLVVAALDDPLQRRGFQRENPILSEADGGDRWVASWLRWPPDDRHLPLEQRRVGMDGVSVWSDGYVNLGMDGNSFAAKIEWRSCPLDEDEFACVIASMVDQYDRFVPPAGPGGWTRE